MSESVSTGLANGPDGDAERQPPKDTDNLLSGMTPRLSLGGDHAPGPQVMREYANVRRIRHSLDEPVLVSVLRSGVCYLSGLFVSLPVIVVTFALILVTLPVRIIWYLLATRCFGKAGSAPASQSLFRLLFSNWTHCDAIWPLSGSAPNPDRSCSKNGDLGSVSGSYNMPHHRVSSSVNSMSSSGTAGAAPTGSSGMMSSLVTPTSVAHCLVTLQGSLDVGEIRDILLMKIVQAADAVTGRLLYPRFTQRVARTCYGCEWAKDANFTIDNHVTQYIPAKNDAVIQTLDDLETFLNDLSHRALSVSQPLWEVLVLNDFGDTKCTLLVFRIHSMLTETICLPRILCRLNDTELAFVNEPRLDPSFYQRLWGIGQMLSLSMIELPAVFCRRSHSRLWSHIRRVGAQTAQAVIGNSGAQQLCESRQRPVSIINQRCSKVEQSQPSLQIPGASGAVTPSLSARSASIGSIPASPHVQHVLTWARVPNVDQLLRAEKLLHCSVEELFLSFIAGAYNRHMKNNGVRHPPDIYASLPVSLDKWGCSSADRNCCQCLVPVRLPVSVEGSIPRLWEVQKCLEDALDGSLPYSMFSMTYALEHLLIPASLATRVTKGALSRAHSESGCVVTFLRGSLGTASIQSHSLHRSSATPGLFSGMLGSNAATPSFNVSQAGSSGRSDFSIKGHRIHSALFFHPLPAQVNSSFTFVVFGREILLSLCTDPAIFPSADALLVSFQDQIQKLLRQVSGRMISPIAAQLIAAAKPIIAAVSTSSSDSEPSEEPSSGEQDVYHPAREQSEVSENAEAVQNNNSLPASRSVPDALKNISAPFNGPPASILNALKSTPTILSETALEDSSLEDLEQLMRTVQGELERIRADPFASRHSNLVRLADLENEMESLQEKIAVKLQAAYNASNLISEESLDRSETQLATVHAAPSSSSQSGTTGLPTPPGPSRSLSMPPPLLARLNRKQSACHAGSLDQTEVGATSSTGSPTASRTGKHHQGHHHSSRMNMLEAFIKSASSDHRRHSEDYSAVHRGSGEVDPTALLMASTYRDQHQTMALYPRYRRHGRMRRLSSPQVASSLSAEVLFSSLATGKRASPLGHHTGTPL